MFLTKIAQYNILWQRNHCLKFGIFQWENERSVSSSMSLRPPRNIREHGTLTKYIEKFDVATTVNAPAYRAYHKPGLVCKC